MFARFRVLNSRCRCEFFKDNSRLHRQYREEVDNTLQEDGLRAHTAQEKDALAIHPAQSQARTTIRPGPSANQTKLIQIGPTSERARFKRKRSDLENALATADASKQGEHGWIL